MIEIKIGHTNRSFRDGDKFIQEKIYNAFNHKIDYKILSKFDFVPKLISDDQKYLKYQWIETNQLTFNKEVLIQIANNFKTLHDSELIFPKNNISQRIKEYLKTLKERNNSIKELDPYYKRILKILKNSATNRPLHNDLYNQNILVDKNNKVYFIDWEYATMGDKHFDLAYFITGSYLNEEQEQIFLEAYDTYWEEYLIQQKILVYYLTILWNNVQVPKAFDDSELFIKLKETVELFDEKKKNNSFRR